MRIRYDARVPPVPLPVDAWLPRVVAAVREHRALVRSASPGAGKTTRVPPALAPDGPVIVLQPRRIAARSIARRIAEEQGWTPGREVGWHVRFERQFGPGTRLLLATEGILTVRLQQDPLLTGFQTVVLDEFHERTIHADLGLALARQAWLARADLRLVVMSATLDTARVSSYLNDCPVIHVPGTPHPVSVHHAPGRSVAMAVREALESGPGQILCFLPGAGEIRRAMDEVGGVAGEAGAETVALHGSLPAAEQDAALLPTPRRRVILATNIAETSLTVPGVAAVVDSGLHKVARYDPDRAIDSLATERITQDSADQRAGRAGRLGPGRVWRLWDARDRLRPHAEAEIQRVDLAGPALDVIAWGGDPRTFGWFDAPDASSLDSALELLARLDAIEGTRITPLGRRMHTLPLHPRLARMLLEARGAREMALACAILSERQFSPVSQIAVPTTTSDLLTAIEAERNLPPHVTRVARELERLSAGHSRGLDERGFRRALLTAYPDRVVRRRAPGSPRVLMASGHGGVIGRESGVRDGDFAIALDVTAAPRGEGAEARIRLASLVDRDWLEATDIRLSHELDESGMVRALEREYYGALVLTERVVPPDPAAASRILADAYLRRGLSEGDQRLVRRLRFAGVSVPVESLAATAASGRHALKDFELADGLTRDVRQVLERDAPERLAIPGGRSVPLEYREDGSVVAEVKLQAMFGVHDTPRIGPRAEPVLLALLAPNGRPVQMTRDLRSFWLRTYPDVRKELRGRYPKHAWPEKPEPPA
jgi:ATP-dependent helicase HrpB